MKVDWNKRYTTIAIYAFIVICCSFTFYNILDNVATLIDKLNWVISVLHPFVIGFVIAYLLNFILVFVEGKVFVRGKLNNLSKKTKRGLGILISYITALTLIFLFMQFVLPQVIDSVVGITKNIPMYIANVSDFIQDISMKFDINDEHVGTAIEKWNEFINYVTNLVTDLLPIVGSLVTGIFASVWNIVLGIVVSIYLLVEKERFIALIKKFIYAVFSTKNAEQIIEIGNRSKKAFGGFLSGMILDSTIMGVLIFIVLSIVKMPFAVLIAVIIASTNIIPVFGPFIGAIPSFIIIMFVSPVKALWFLVIIFVMQQLDGNIMAPKILGDSIGISAFWVLFSVVVMGELFGLLGMIVGVPLFAVIYSIVKDIIELRLAKKGLSKNTEDYL